MDIDLNEVSILVHTARAGSFCRAVRKLAMPANTVSRRVQQLEDRLQTRLLQRSPRKLNLTPAGKRFSDRCAGGIDDIETTSSGRGRKCSTPGRNRKGILRVSAPTDPFTHFNIDVIKRYQKRYPQVRLDFVLNGAHSDLSEEAINVAFRWNDRPDRKTSAQRKLSRRRHLV